MAERRRRDVFTLGVGGALAACSTAAPAQDGRVVRTEKQTFKLSVVTRGLENPWALAFLPDGAIVVTERPGRLRILRDGKLSAPIGGVPAVFASRQGGLLDVCPHPDFATNRMLYLSFSTTTAEGAATTIARARLDGATLVDVHTILVAEPRQTAGANHFGSRFVFARDRTLYASCGDRFVNKERAQALDDLAGKIVRLNDDGSVPRDNPFVGRAGARPEIFSYGHRNPQGLALHPATGIVWSHEHGPRGGDEVNVVRAGGNYGWPKATHGIDYNGSVISPNKTLPGMVDPVHVWVPSIAPSGMAFASGDAYPAWRSNLFVGALAGRMLVRLELDGETVLREERMLEGAVGRIRDVRCAPDGRLWLLTDASDGALIRLDPA